MHIEQSGVVSVQGDGEIRLPRTNLDRPALHGLSAIQYQTPGVSQRDTVYVEDIDI
jgi:hypothetical protein